MDFFCSQLEMIKCSMNFRSMVLDRSSRSSKVVFQIKPRRNICQGWLVIPDILLLSPRTSNPNFDVGTEPRWHTTLYKSKVETNLILFRECIPVVNKHWQYNYTQLTNLADKPARVGYWCSFFFFLPLFFPSLDVMILKDKVWCRYGTTKTYNSVQE